MTEIESPSCGSLLKWYGLYAGMENWKNIVTPESYVHPAKMAPLLCQRVFEHLEELKMISQDSLVCDFMAGTGTTNIIASMRGYSSVSIELEPRFVRIEAGNRRRLEGYLGSEPKWRIMQGDSRRLSKMLNGGDPKFSMMSPSYGGSELRSKNRSDQGWFDRHPEITVGFHGAAKYQSGKNVGHLKTAIVSPPYEATQMQSNPKESYGEIARKSYGDGSRDLAVLAGTSLRYGTENSRQLSNPKNVGNLKAGVISPPYQEAISSSKVDAEGSLRRAGYDPKKYMGGKGRQLTQKGAGLKYGDSKKQVGNLRAGVTSPPYFNSDNRKPSQELQRDIGLKDLDYGNAKGQLGNETGETYESAMLVIYREAHKAGIAPLVTVTKNPTRDGKLVRLDLITADLLQKAGYRIFDYHQAVLFKSHDESSINLDGEIVEKTSHKGRIGFFKQLSLKKGSIAASWEDVIFAE